MQTLKRWAMALLTPVPLLGLVGLPRYLANWRRLKENAPNDLRLADSYPCLSDWVQSTPFDPHYFYQAGWLARRLRASGVSAHTDVGSDVRMIGVLSAFIDVTFIDYRPLSATLAGLRCEAGNLTGLGLPDASLPSLSCLHVVEHVGLGRYGDPLDIAGSERALAELQRVLAPGGRLYLSVPVGRERICYNAHRVFSPRSIVDALSGLALREFSLVDDDGRFIENADPTAAAALDYGCGLFVFERRVPHAAPLPLDSEFSAQ